MAIRAVVADDERPARSFRFVQRPLSFGIDVFIAKRWILAHDPTLGILP